MKIHDDIIDRYVTMIKVADRNAVAKQDPAGMTYGHLLWMLTQIRVYQGSTGSEKYHRWLGYVQNALIAGGLTNVETERDFTRPYFEEKEVVPIYSPKMEAMKAEHAALIEQRDKLLVISQETDKKMNETSRRLGEIEREWGYEVDKLKLRSKS